MTAEETRAQRKKELPKAAQLLGQEASWYPGCLMSVPRSPAPPNFCHFWGRTLTQADRGTCWGRQEGRGERREEKLGKGDTALRRPGSESPRGGHGLRNEEGRRKWLFQWLLRDTYAAAGKAAAERGRGAIGRQESVPWLQRCVHIIMCVLQYVLTLE